MSGGGALQHGVDPRRVAELLITPRDGGVGRRGSGYRVSASAVLTAAHVVGDAIVRVRFNADRPNEWVTDGDVEWLDSASDVAIVILRDGADDDLAPVSFGRVGDRDAVVPCTAVGFPLFKLRTDRGQVSDDGPPWRYRDTCHVSGSIAVLSNLREGTLEVSVHPPGQDLDQQQSPWQGMSGAAVWSAGRIIGMISEHHRSDGLGRLAATRVDRWYEVLGADTLRRLAGLLGLPPRACDLPDVVGPNLVELAEARRMARVRDIAPETLVGRRDELAGLVRFCAGSETYEWWCAPPWAGKTALAAWFVLHPPVGVTIVSFFVTGQLADQADSDAFTDDMIEQLAAVAGEPLPVAATRAARDGERRRLLECAAARVREGKGRLLLVVDGLDEDQGAKPGSGLPSIASVLPRRPPDGVQVLVTSRHRPGTSPSGIPADVAADHPLRRCAIRDLDAFRDAEDTRFAAQRELMEQLHADQLQVDLIALITASGGGLTSAELAELSGYPKFMLDARLGSAFGRSFTSRAMPDAPGREDHVHLFAHETLRATAERELAQDLRPYQERIYAWADRYCSAGWPENTPQYLLRPYGRLSGQRRRRRTPGCFGR